MLYVGFHAIYHGDSSSYPDVPKLILERVSCKQTMQTAPLEIWKSEPVFRRRGRRRKNLVRNEFLKRFVFRTKLTDHQSWKSIPDEIFRPNTVQSDEYSPHVTTCYLTQRSRDYHRPPRAQRLRRRRPGNPRFHWKSPHQWNE